MFGRSSFATFTLKSSNRKHEFYSCKAGGTERHLEPHGQPGLPLMVEVADLEASTTGLIKTSTAPQFSVQVATDGRKQLLKEEYGLKTMMIQSMNVGLQHLVHQTVRVWRIASTEKWT